MGNCFNDTPVKKKTGSHPNSSNPINLIMGTWNIDNIKNKWQQNQLEIISAKLNSNDKTISYAQFMTLFPKLRIFGEKTNKNIYKLFNVSETSRLTKQELLNALTLIEKNQNSQVMSNMIFYVYSTAPDRKILNQSDIAQFIKENKKFRIQLTPQNQDNYPLYMNNREFDKLFAKYDLNKYKALFQWDLTDQQRKFALTLGSKGIKRKLDEKVFLVQYQWFLYWKVFMQIKYGIHINISDQGQSDSKNNKFLARRYSSTNMNIQDVQKDKKIPPIKNYVLQGDHENCLVQNLHEFHDYILVPQWVWKQFILLYGGDPVFQRNFPNIYLYQITVVQVDQNGKFIPLKSISYANKEKSSTIKEFRSKKTSQNSLCFYKYPGKQDWTIIENIELNLQNLNLHHKTFIVFLPKQFRQTFQGNYNVQLKSKKKTIKKHIKNYGSLLNAQIDGVLKKGYVVQFSNTMVTLEIKDQKGNFNLNRFSLDSLKECNSNQLSNSYQNGLAGLQNIGNTCFMNAVIQCLIRTPFFGDYLQKQDYLKQNQKSLILQELYKIYKQSKKSRESIQMNKFKRAFDKHFPFFQGYAQHDAQQFLICLLSRISQQLKQKRISFGQSKDEEDNTKRQLVNKKVIKFFSGTMETTTKCIQCKSTTVRVQPFFTYSLSLPNIMESQYEYIYISKQLSLKKMCMTLPKNIIVQDFVKEVSKQLNIPCNNLFFYSIFNNEWMSNIQQQCPQRQIQYFKNYDIKIGCYQILSKQNVQYNDFRYSNFTNKSVKIQMRNRIYEQKTKNYRSFYAPLMMEINSQTTGTSLKKAINQKLNKFIDANYHDSNQNIRLSSSSIRKTRQNQDLVHKSSIFSSAKEQQQKNLLRQTPKGDQEKDNSQFSPYQIRFMKNYNNNDSYCWFCRDQLRNIKVNDNSDKFCNGCNFLQNKPLFQQQNFKVYGDSLVIVIDWNDALATKNFKIINDYSCHQASLRAKNRKTKIEKLLRQNSDMVQKVELKCQKEGCQGKQVQRVQKIKNTPNILLVHLKRFKYEDNHFMKLNNPVIYPQNLILPGSNDQYELYGSLVHTGSGMGGHYYSFVKVSNLWFRCDDEKVFQDKQGQHIDEKAYILFYKKVNFQPSLVCLRF